MVHKVKYQEVELNKNFTRNIPLPCEKVTTIELVLPVLKPQYEVIKTNLALPRFIEVPYPQDLMNKKQINHANHYRQHMHNIHLNCGDYDAGLCEVETLGNAITYGDFRKILSAGADPVDKVRANWLDGK